MLVAPALALTAGPGQTDWPLYGLVDDIRPALSAMFANAQIGALATLIGVDGPSPRAIGAQMLITPDGAAAGYVSGGCVEGSLALLGQEVAASGAHRRVVFGRGSAYLDVQLVCGARIEVLIERAAPDDETLQGVLAARAQRRPVIRQIDHSGVASLSPADSKAPLLHLSDDGLTVARRYDPPTRLLVLGGDPVALALCQLARQSGLETILARRLGPESAPDGVADRYLARGPRDAFSACRLDPWTAVVTTTHDIDSDHEALLGALASEAFYVGALGSRRRVADRIAKLEAAGLDWAAVRRLRAPVGLDIGAETPFEIAVSVLADIICSRRTRG